MAASTGPAENNTISIQTVELGDTFNLWRDVTNTAVYKINKLKVYDVVDSNSISTSIAAGGTLSVSLADNVNKGLTFQQPVLFSSGVTFNGPVTFNAETVTLNANIVTIDDYNIVLGDTAAASDTNINTAGGGGILLNRGSGATAEWLWQYSQVHGITGVWRSNTHIGFSGATSGIYPHNGGSLRVHGSGLQIDGGSTTDHGLLINLTSTGVAGTTGNRILEFSRYSPTGTTAFIQVLNGLTYNNGKNPFVNIPNGANRKIVTTASAHGFVFGQPLYLNSSTYTAARANSANTSEVVGVVSKVIDAFNFEITFIGEIFGDFSVSTSDGGSLTPGAVYYLSPDVAGKITPSVPISAGQVHKALMIATGSNSAIVYPFTGGVLSSPVTLSTSTSLGVNFDQYNQFKIGDFVRWEPSGKVIGYTGTNNVKYSYNYTNGYFAKAQANSSAEAEVAGMVVAVVDIGGNTPIGVNQSFTLLMDGFFSGLSLDGIYGDAVTNGTVYFLAKDCIGTTADSCFENNTPAFSSSYPTSTGSVRKPLFMATNSNESNFSGYLFSYRGDEVSVQGLSADTKLEDLLVRNLGSCGAVEDLEFGVRDGNGTAGGVRVMRLPKNSKGTVEIGYFGTYAAGKAGASLDVKGVIRSGRDSATNGGDIVVSRYGSESGNLSSYPETLNVFGSANTTGNSVISYGIRPRSGAAGYESTTGNAGSIVRTSLEVGSTGSGAYSGIGVYTTSASNAAQGTALTVTELLTVNTNTMTYRGGLTTLTSSGTSALKLTSNSGSSQTTASPLWIEHPKNTISLFLGDGNNTSTYTADEYNGNIRFNGSNVGWGDISYYPNGSAKGLFRFSKNSTTVSSTPNASVGVGSLIAHDTTESTSTSIGALTITGGLGVAKTINAAGITTGSLTIGSARMASPSGSAPLFAARAWAVANWSGSAISLGGASSNVSSVSADVATRRVTFNFSPALPTSDYVVLVNTQRPNSGELASAHAVVSRTTSSCVIVVEARNGDQIFNNNANKLDNVQIAVFC